MKSLIFIAALLVVSCSSKKPEYAKEFNPVPPEVGQEAKPVSAGSLYNGRPVNYFTDVKAFREGDIITIKVFENIRGQGNTNTKTDEKGDINLSAPSPVLLGKPVFNKNPVLGLKTSNSDTYKGSASTDRSARLIATISARVVKVYPNGNMFIVGKKVVKVNDDDQVLLISGIVRPYDIMQDNSVDSSRISDMYVEYNGRGYMAEASRPGWLARFLKTIWPF